MIEIICKENQQEEEEVKLPKNIRQVGSPDGRHKIYLEDYVYTYLKNNARANRRSAAVLFGKSTVSQDIRYTFISGALECTQAVFQFENIYLDESFWEYIYMEEKEKFPDTEVIGWFVGEWGEGLELSPAIEAAHRKYFAGREKLLMLMDSAEEEERFYVCEQGYLQKREGYYIYYEKNTAMQEMFVKSSMEEPISEAEKALQNYRSMLLEKRERKVENHNKRFLYGATSLVMTALCIVGITTINNYQKMKEVEGVLYTMKEEEADVVVESIPADVEPTAEEDLQSETPEQEEEPQPETPTAEEESQPETPAAEEEPQSETPTAEEESQPETPVQEEEPQYYTVQAGDTLESICRQFYRDKSMIAALCHANGIENGDKIQAGQTLVLP